MYYKLYKLFISNKHRCLSLLLCFSIKQLFFLKHSDEKERESSDLGDSVYAYSTKWFWPVVHVAVTTWNKRQLLNVEWKFAVATDRSENIPARRLERCHKSPLLSQAFTNQLADYGRSQRSQGGAWQLNDRGAVKENLDIDSCHIWESW